MTTQFNGTEFVSPQASRFSSTFEGIASKAEFTTSLAYRRNMRRTRRQNRAL